MTLRSLSVLAALLLAVGACAPAAAPPQQAAAPRGASAGAPVLPVEVERVVGPAYAAPELQALVNRVGQKLVSQASIPGSFRFYVLDQPMANAYALPSGYVFVSRGMLALLGDEAELAATLGHEIGHVVSRHAAQREQARRQAIDIAVGAARQSGSMTVGRAVAQDRLLALRRYSREQELEADAAALNYLIKAGYRGDAMTSVIEKLRREDAFDRRRLGLSSDSERSALSTHPAPDDRLAALRQLPGGTTPGESGREAYLALLDGMSVDDAPEEGFVRGAAFLHPLMRLAFQALPDFRLHNATDGVYGRGSDRSGLFFSCRREKVTGTMAAWMRDKLQPTPVDIQTIEIDGVEAAVGTRPRGLDAGMDQVRTVMIRRDDGFCYFRLVADGPDRDRRIEEMTAATRSFRRLSAAEAGALRPYRLRVLPARSGTAEALAARLPYPDLRLERLLLLNGVDGATSFARLDRIKTVEP